MKFKSSTDKYIDMSNSKWNNEALLGNGYYMLSGIETCDVDVLRYGEAEIMFCIFICLNGRTYMAYEDPDDGYRSYLSSIFDVTDMVEVENKFPAQPVYVQTLQFDPEEYSNFCKFDYRHKNDYNYPGEISGDLGKISDDETYNNSNLDIKTIYRIDGNHKNESDIILKFGTNYNDAYYPYAICQYYPEHLPINDNR